MADDAHTLIRCVVGPDVETFDVPVQIRVTAHFKHRPLDADNICAKLYIDGLVAAGVIRDDDPKHVVSVTTASYVDREWPRLVIWIQPIKNIANGRD
jgi:Holliday junction resolvase RusA-like endonuclease